VVEGGGRGGYGGRGQTRPMVVYVETVAGTFAAGRVTMDQQEKMFS
jgi:hypothetical protein